MMVFGTAQLYSEYVTVQILLLQHKQTNLRANVAYVVVLGTSGVCVHQCVGLCPV